MSWRKWFVRSLVFSIAGLCACAGYLYRYWTNPAAVRRQVIAVLQQHFPGAQITLDGAHMSLFGGIILNDLRLARKDDADQLDFVQVPSATICLDKENLLDGPLAMRKLEMDHLRLRLVRERNGRWNLDGVCKLADPSIPLPTVQVHQGTLVLDDRLEGADLPSLEIHNIELTFLNDPLSIVQIDGRAHSDLFGELEIRGGRNRRTGDLSLAVQIQGVTVSPALLQRLAARCPNGSLDNLRLEGQADVLAKLTYTPGATPSFGYDVNCRLTRGKLEHPALPLPLDDLDARLRCHDGELLLEELKARSGSAEVWARGAALMPCPEANFEAALQIKHLQLREELFEKLPKQFEQFRKLYDQFRPAGPATIHVACARRGGKWVPLGSGAESVASLSPEDIKATFYNFPYPLERVSGSLKFNLASKRTNVDILAYSGSRPVFIKGSWQGKDEQVDAVFDIQASDVPLDDKLLGALRGPAGAPRSSFYNLARSFNARGKADIKALIRHVPGAPRKTFANEYHVYFHDVDLNWDHFPYPLTAVSGILDIYPHAMQFYNFVGRHGAGNILVSGRTTTDPSPDGSKPRLIIDITGKNVPLDADLKHGMGAHPMLLKTWDTFAPSGQTNFTAHIDRLKGPADESEVLKEMRVTVEMRGGIIRPHFFRYALADLTSRFHYHNHKVTMDWLAGHHGSTQISLGPSTVDLETTSQGGFYAVLKQFRARDLIVDADLLAALPPSLAAACTAMDLRDPVLIHTDLVVAGAPDSQPDIYWKGQLWLRKARLRAGLELNNVTGALACCGRHRYEPRRGQILELDGNFRLDQAVLVKQPFHDVQGHFFVNEKMPDVLNIGIKAPLFRGDISGQVRLEMNSADRTHYELNLTASQIDLQEFGRHNISPNSQLKGLAAGRLVLKGQSSGVDSLEGDGSIDVPRGHIYNLPLLLDLLKFLNLRTPDRTMFDEAKAVFKINGPRVRVDRLELLGTAISLYGNGAFKLDGGDINDIKLDFYPSWGRVEQLMPEVLRSIPAEIGKQMLVIEMRGRVGPNPNDLKFTKKPVPFVVNPVLRMRDKLAGAK